MPDNLWKLSATETAHQIKDGKVSCEAMINSHLDQLNQTSILNAVTTRFDESAIKAARNADKALIE